ncbi:hypothetical protein TNCV_1021801 [Trichonephila clavipes]|nr:hypothetical protein TNCV_1021801 [Trichonephila clavipes]
MIKTILNFITGEQHGANGERYSRRVRSMANHRLPTLSMQARAFCKRDVLAERNEDQGGYLHRRRQLILIASAFNAQSLVAHAGDIESDNILMNPDYMVISET